MLLCHGDGAGGPVIADGFQRRDEHVADSGVEVQRREDRIDGSLQGVVVESAKCPVQASLEFFDDRVG
ncbi:hypothetical protein [Candidatus Amarobacter glycogenicus]|uniref:hypothetical protein n=1 Tax=Candidatus Amarobacter glycogenicus TaxID=3140699 RepID=UPI0031CCCB7B